jgi:hypothetical protein
MSADKKTMDRGAHADAPLFDFVAMVEERRFSAAKRSLSSPVILTDSEGNSQKNILAWNAVLRLISYSHAR